MFGKRKGMSIATVNTMDWEALGFYQKLGYQIEHKACAILFLSGAGQAS
jgi:hypothetical protein